MKRISMKNKIGLLAGMGAGLSLLTLAPNANAQTATYASTRRQVKACVLIPSKDAPLFPPYAFYELDSRTDIKPGTWDILNPLASATVSGAGYRRWNGNVNASKDGSFAQNAPLAKSMAPYWEADLSVISDDDLRKMDIALLRQDSGTAINLTDIERERLRRYVDGGGVLWVELSSGGSNLLNFIFDVSGSGTGGSNRVGGGYHPVLRFPNALSDFDLAQIVGTPSGVAYGTPAPNYMSSIVGSPGTSISVGDYGAGHIVVSTAPIAANINSEIKLINGVVNLRANTKYDSDLKILANMIAWSSSAPTQGANSRRTNSTGERVGGQLGEKWTWTNTNSSTVGVGSGAVIYKGLVFYVDSSNILHAFDRDPSQNLLNGPTPDDGMPDFLSLGTPYDEVFNTGTKAILSGRVSTPTVASTANGDYVAVTNDSGSTATYTITGGGLTNKKVFDASGSGQLPNTIPVPSPIFSEGLLFAVTTAPNNKTDGVWRIVPLNPDTGANAFGSATAIAPFADNTNNNAFEGMPTLTGPISAGYIKDTVTGALDKVIYCPTVPVTVGGTAAPNPAGLIAALWFNTKDEPLDPFVVLAGSTVAFHPQGARAKIPWYLGAGASDPLSPVLHITHQVTNADGSVTQTHSTLHYLTDFNVYMGGIPLGLDPNGKPQFSQRETEVLLNTPLADGDEVHADYTLNWPGSALPDGSGNTVQMTAGDMAMIGRRFVTAAPTLGTGAAALMTATNIIGGAAISSQDLTIFNTTFTGGANGNGMTGRVYGLREQFGPGTVVGSGNNVTKGVGTQVAWAFSPEPSIGTTANQASRLINTDPYAAIGTGAPYTNFIPVGSPAIANDTVYVVGQATASGLAGNTIIMALRANPSMAITLGASSGIPQPLPIGWQVRIFNRSQQSTDTDWFDQAPHLTLNAQFTIDPDSGNISIFDCRLSDGNVLNLGEPIVIGVKPLQVQGQNGPVTPPPIIVILPNPTDVGAISPLDNLAWYMIIPIKDNPTKFLPKRFQGMMPTSGPAVIGDSLYFGSNLGVVSVDLRGFGSQHYIHVTPQPVNGAPDNSDSNMRIHLLTPSTAFKGMLEPPTGTERTLVMGLPGGVSAFDSRPTLIADGTRLLEVDYGGNALWTMDATLSYVFDQAGDSVTTKTNLARPGVAHRMGLDQFFFADTNNNRVTLADRGGKTLWELTSFHNDMGFIPPDYPLTLNAPTDVEFHQDTYTQSVTFASPKGTFSANATLTNPLTVNRYLVADSGNFRLLEIVDVLDTNGNPISMTDGMGHTAVMQRQVSFVSKSLGEQNRDHRYRTIQEFSVPDPNGGNPTLYIVSAIANTARGTSGGNVSVLTSTGNNQEGLGGSVEVLRRNLTDYTQDGASFAVFTSLILPQRNGAGGLVMGANGKPAVAAYVPLNNVTFCKGFYNAAADSGAAFPLQQFSYQYMIADSGGCYVVNSDGVILWRLTSAEYFAMTARPLRASSIQRLTQADLNTNGSDTRPWYPRFLITNRYEGPDAVPDIFPIGGVVGRGQIHGEVFEIRSLDYERTGGSVGPIYSGGSNGLQVNFGGASPITWLFPNEKQTAFNPNSNGPSQPIYSIQRFVGNLDNATSTSLLQQPTYAERPN